MSYQKLNLKTGDTLSAKHIEHIEDGIVEAGVASGGGSKDAATVNVVFSSPKKLTLDDVAYEGKTYRDIFITDARASWDMELDRLDITSYNASAPTYTTSHWYSGSRSLSFSANAQSKYFYVGSDTDDNPPEGGIYLAAMVKVTSYSSGRLGLSMSSGAVQAAPDYTKLNEWQLISTYHIDNTPTGHVYVGGFSTTTGSMYVDNVVAVHIGYFEVPPTKEEFNALYQTYCEILRENAEVTEKAVEVADRNDPLFSAILTGDYKYSAEDAHGVIVDLMNQKAKELGMTNSTFYNPYGGAMYGFNRSTARDLMRMTVHASAYRRLMEYLGLNASRKMHIYGPNERDASEGFHLQNYYNTTYAKVHGEGATAPYYVLMRKNGGWASPVSEQSYCGCLIAEIEGKLVAAAMARVSGGDSSHTGREYRSLAQVELLDICYDVIKNGSTTSKVTSAEYACACIIPQNPILWPGRDFEILYEQNADVQFNPASTSKLMSGIVLMDLDFNPQEYHELVPEEFVDSDTSFVAYKGDIMKIDDAMYLNLITSNGPNTLAICRHFGNKVLAERERWGLFRTVTVTAGENIVLHNCKDKVLEGTKFSTIVESTSGTAPTITVKVGTNDVTSTAITSISTTKKKITIPKVTGPVTITVT